jgi:hypothetical protein
MPEPTHEERAGARVVREIPDRKSLQEQYRAESVQKSGDIVDSVDNLTTIVREGLGVGRPTGQRTAVPRGDHYSQSAPAAATPDPIVGAAVAAAMLAEAGRRARAAIARLRKKRDHSGSS